MNLAWYWFSMMGGALVGYVAHEAAHAVTASVLGNLVAVEWNGGIRGGPDVTYQTQTRDGWRDQSIRKAPLGLGLIGLAVTLATSTPRALWWWALAGATLACLWTSPADLFTDAADVADDHA